MISNLYICVVILVIIWHIGPPTTLCKIILKYVRIHIFFILTFCLENFQKSLFYASLTLLNSWMLFDDINSFSYYWTHSTGCCINSGELNLFYGYFEFLMWYLFWKDFGGFCLSWSWLGHDLALFHVLPGFMISRRKKEQAGAELCQAQVKLGLEIDIV